MEIQTNAPAMPVEDNRPKKDVEKSKDANFSDILSSVATTTADVAQGKKKPEVAEPSADAKTKKVPTSFVTDHTAAKDKTLLAQQADMKAIIKSETHVQKLLQVNKQKLEKLQEASERAVDTKVQTKLEQLQHKEAQKLLGLGTDMDAKLLKVDFKPSTATLVSSRMIPTSEFLSLQSKAIVVSDRVQDVAAAMSQKAQPSQLVQQQVSQTINQQLEQAQEMRAQEQASAPRHVWEQNSVRLAKEMMKAHQAGQQKLEMTLNPAHLGKVSVSIQTDKDKRISVSMRVENPNSMIELNKHVERLQETMREQGLSLGEFSMHSGDGGTGKRQQEFLLANQAVRDAGVGGNASDLDVVDDISMQAMASTSLPHSSELLSVHI